MKQFYDAIIKVLGVTESEINDEMSQSSVPAWDSFNALLLVTEVEAAFGVKFTMEETVSAQSVGAIKKILERHGVAENNI